MKSISAALGHLQCSLYASELFNSPKSVPILRPSFRHHCNSTSSRVCFLSRDACFRVESALMFIDLLESLSFTPPDR